MKSAPPDNDFPDELDTGELREPTPDEIRTMLESQANVMLSQTLGALAAFAPHLTPDQMLDLAKSTVDEQLGPISGEIMPSMLFPDAITKHPTIILRLGRGKEDIKVDVKAAKRLERVSDPGAAAQAGLLLALLTSPSARAVLKAFGWQYQFMQTAEQVGGSIILHS